LFGPNLLDLRAERFAERPRAEALSRAEENALERAAVLFVPGRGSDLLAGARELRLRRRGPLELLDLSVEHRLDTIEGGAAGEGHARDQQRRVEFHLLPHADVRREPRVDERPIQAVRSEERRVGKERRAGWG